MNIAWRNRSFRGFADYMQTREFLAHVQALLRLAKRRRVAIMCAEAVPWRCHRSLIVDALSARQCDVWHMLGPHSVKQHTLTVWARVEAGKVWYPG